MKFIYAILGIIALLSIYLFLTMAPIGNAPRNFGKWDVSTKTAEDGEIKPFFMLDATQPIQVSTGATVTPTLFLVCSHGSTNIVIDFKALVAKPRGEWKFIWLNPRVDGDYRKTNFSLGANPNMAFSDSGKDLAQRMSYGEELIIEIQDALVTPNRVIFDIRGFDRAVRPFEARCGIR